jgi:hypothetical protein
VHEHQAKDPQKKHRHDIGCPDHGTVSDEGTTRNIQVVLGIWIAASVALTLYALVEAVFRASAS